MRLHLRGALSLIALLILAFGVAACGDEEDDGEEGASTSVVPEEFQPVTAPPEGARQGGVLTVIGAGDIDYMDPGAAYYQPTYMLTNAAHRALLTWAPDDHERPTPDLAEGAPEISDDGQTIEFTLREGVRFSPPVDREVTAADVEYAIERSTLPGVANQYFSAYASDIIGYEEAAEEAADNPTGGAPDIEGVSAPDDRTLRIELGEPETAVAEVIVQAMALPVSAPVPEEHASEFDAENPSTYGNHVVFTGPYMVENDESGELTGYTPGREISLVRNPNWDQETDPIRPAYVDEIDIQEGFEDTASASRRILNGEGQISFDFPPPTTVLKEAATEAQAEQLQLPVIPGYRHIALNTQEPPFDDINVRKAVVANSDREALRNTRGGELVGQVASHYISPGFPGFEESGGVEGFEDLDFLANINGDPELAAEYMREAGYESGRCEGAECEISMVASNVTPHPDTAAVFEGQLEDLGFKVNLRLVSHSIMYTRFCSVPEQQPQLCPSVGWLPDFRDPQAMLDVPFYGPTIDPENNSNWPQLDVPEVNEAIEEARLVEGDDARAEAWAEVDRLVSEQAAAVPWIWENYPLLQSTDVAGVVNLNNASWDLAFTSLK